MRSAVVARGVARELRSAPFTAIELHAPAGAATSDAESSLLDAAHSFRTQVALRLPGLPRTIGPPSATPDAEHARLGDRLRPVRVCRSASTQVRGDGVNAPTLFPAHVARGDLVDRSALANRLDLRDELGLFDQGCAEDPCGERLCPGRLTSRPEVRAELRYVPLVSGRAAR